MTRVSFVAALVGGFAIGAGIGLSILAVSDDDAAVPLANMVAAADRVVLGDVMDVFTLPSADGRTVITHVTVAPIRMLRGRRDSTGLVDFEFEGGCFDGFCAEVEGAPAVSLDDAVLVLLGGQSPVCHGRGALRLSGFSEDLPPATPARVADELGAAATTAELLELVEHLVERTGGGAPLYAAASVH